MAKKDISETGVVRLNTRPQFVFVRGGRSERRRSMVVQARVRAGSDVIGAGFTATRKIGKSVVRNRAKRRLREAARVLLPLHGMVGTDYVFIARRETAAIGWQRLLDDMESALISHAQEMPAGSGPA